jgi:IS66 C-terminal element
MRRRIVERDPAQCRAPPQHEQSRRGRAARRIVVEPAAHTAHASGNGPQLRARYGQNDRAIALGRRAWLFAGSDRGGERAAAMYTLIATAKLNNINPQAWLADVLARIADHPASRLQELLPWNWNALTTRAAAA